MPQTPDRTSAIEKIASLMRGVNIAMLTTIAPDGSLRSRPMALQQVEFDGDLWFFTGSHTPKVDQIDDDARVNVAFSHPSKQNYVSVSGRARLVNDRAKAEELWNPLLKAWFPQGLDDPELALLKVEVEGVEYWDAPSGPVAQIAGFVHSLATGKSPENIGDHEKLQL